MPETRDDHARRARFEAEVTAADLLLSPEDRERLFQTWTGALRYREALRAAPIAREEEPAFVEKPTMLGGGA
jgi:hypothetical protein